MRKNGDLLPGRDLMEAMATDQELDTRETRGDEGRGDEGNNWIDTKQQEHEIVEKTCEDHEPCVSKVDYVHDSPH
jgi:hypothetical protein